MYLEGIEGSIRSSLLGENTRIEIVVEAEPLQIVADHAVSIGLLVNELATNAVKYAFPENRGRILLGFQRRDGEVTLLVHDDGVGLAAAGSQTGASSLGTWFIDAFVRQIGGTLAKATSAEGTTVAVRLPTSILST